MLKEKCRLCQQLRQPGEACFHPRCPNKNNGERVELNGKRKWQEPRLQEIAQLDGHEGYERMPAA
jgi:hypothetical protein